MLSCRALGLVYREELGSLDREVGRVRVDETWQVGADFWETFESKMPLFIHWSVDFTVRY